MAQMFDPHRRFDNRLEEAARLLRADPDDLVSLKIRPIKATDNFPDTDAYVYDDEYRHIDASLTDVVVLESDHGMDGYYSRLRLVDGDEVLFVRHETGPEIIFIFALITKGAAAVGASAAAANQVIKLINTVKDAISSGNSAKKKGRTCNRYHLADGINLEKRLRQGAKIVKQISLAADRGEKLIEKIDELDL